MPTLDELTRPELSVTLRGKRYKVSPMDGFGYQLVNGMTKENSVHVMYRVAARCLMGSMPRDEVFGTEDVLGLTAEEVGQVVQVASGQIQEVEATLPNAGKAGAETGGQESSPPSSPESHPTIQLAS